MPKRIIKNGRHWPLADRLLGEWLGDRNEVGLSEAMGGLSRATANASEARAADEAPDSFGFIRECVDGSAGADAVSRLLRARGFRKAGMMGSATTYDRQVLYRREPPHG